MLGVTVVRLFHRRLADGTTPPGLSCDEQGVFFCGGTPLVMRARDAARKTIYRERHVAEINFALSAAFDAQVDFGGRMGLLKRIAGHLTDGNLSAARMAALHLHMPELHDVAGQTRLNRAEALLAAHLRPIASPPVSRSRCSCPGRDAERARTHKRDVSKEPRIPRGEAGGGQWTSGGGIDRDGKTPGSNSLLVPAQMAPVMPWARPAPLPWTLPPPPTEISPFLDLPGDTLDPGKPLRNPFPRNERCVEEWDHAFEYCDDLEKKGLLGKGDHKESGRTYRQCVLGQVSEECGGSS